MKGLFINNYLYQISKCIIHNLNGTTKLNEKGKRLALQRAKLIAAAEEKVWKLKELIEPYINDNHILVYCGAAKLLGDNEDITAIDDSELRQIDVVTKILGNDLNMKVSQFTSREGIYERKILKEKFQQGDNLQVPIAIKCLDEGVNIPAIKTAFILASTTNPKEYIQRRGRVLRLMKQKYYAEIFDFVTIPRPLNEVSHLTNEEVKNDLSLINNELTRIEEFARISMNPMSLTQ